jgi:hypothetical protein
MMMISAITPPPIYMVDAPPPCSLPQEVGHRQWRVEGVSFRRKEASRLLRNGFP